MPLNSIWGHLNKLFSVIQKLQLKQIQLNFQECDGGAVAYPGPSLDLSVYSLINDHSKLKCMLELVLLLSGV